MKLLLVTICLLITLPAFSDVGAPYRVKMVALDNGETRHIKYNLITGETWWSENTNWKKIKENVKPPRSTYEFSIVNVGSSWRALRVDTVTGETWKNSKGVWVKFTQSKR